MSRVIAYVDGFNLYFGLKAAKLKRLYWLDLVALAGGMIRPEQSLERVHYFTARIRGNTQNVDSVRRQSDYLDALQASPKFTLHEGHFLQKTASCRSCGATWPTYEEKMSDVNLGIQLLLDAFDDRFDTAIILSGDSDLATPVRRVLERFSAKRVLIAFPPKRHSAELKAASSGTFIIGEDKLRKSQLPDPVLTPSGIRIQRPFTWR